MVKKGQNHIHVVVKRSRSRNRSFFQEVNFACIQAKSLSGGVNFPLAPRLRWPCIQISEPFAVRVDLFLFFAFFDIWIGNRF